MQIRLALEGNLEKYWQDEWRLGAGAVTTAMRRASSLLKNDARRQTISAGLDRNARPGKSVSKTWTSEVYPKRRTSMGAAARVWSKWPAAIEAFEKGAIINARGGKWLAVPAEDLSREHQQTRKTIRIIRQRQDLQFIQTRNPNVGLLINKTTKQPVFWLYRQVRITRRINFYNAAEKWGAKIPDYIVSEWNKRAAKTGQQGL